METNGEHQTSTALLPEISRRATHQNNDQALQVADFGLSLPHAQQRVEVRRARVGRVEVHHAVTGSSAETSGAWKLVPWVSSEQLALRIVEHHGLSKAQASGYADAAPFAATVTHEGQ